MQFFLLLLRDEKLDGELGKVREVSSALLFLRGSIAEDIQILITELLSYGKWPQLICYTLESSPN